MRKVACGMLNGWPSQIKAQVRIALLFVFETNVFLSVSSSSSAILTIGSLIITCIVSAHLHYSVYFTCVPCGSGVISTVEVGSRTHVSRGNKDAISFSNECVQDRSLLMIRSTYFGEVILAAAKKPNYRGIIPWFVRRLLFK